jgi:predicted LPLAT superfamily acyltransferase
LIPVFNLREPGGHYRFFGFPPQRPVMPSHDKRNAYLYECATQFAANLESILKRDPLQWYNFFPFWNEADSSASANVSGVLNPAAQKSATPS